MKMPPQIPGHPLLGNALDIHRDPLGFLMSMTRQYGDILAYRMVIWPGVLINHPDYIQHVLQENNRSYSKREIDYEILQTVLGQGLLTSDGEFWLRQRRLIQPAFHRQRLAAFGDLMTSATLQMLSRWEVFARQGQVVEVSDEMMRLTLSIVCKSLFGTDIGVEAEVVGRAFTTINTEIANFFRSLFPLPIVLRRPRYRSAVAALNQVVEGIIARRRASLVNQELASQPQDLLAMLLQARDEDTHQGMTDSQLRDEVVTLLLAGHETTANALAWTWYLLFKNPAVGQRLREELAQVLCGRLPTLDDLPELPYNRMVIQEAMRLYPPAWLISRRAENADEIGGYSIPAGTRVSMSPFLMHHHPGFWENPEGFDPLRFTPERTVGRPPYAYFPFGGGPRLCIGRDFALQEAQLVLATVVQHCRLDLLPGHPVEPEPLVTLRPKHGLKMTLHDFYL